MNILFVCLGNICRSPMAEYIAKNIIKKNNIKNVNVQSSGTSGFHDGENMHHGTKETLINHHIDSNNFYSKRINKELFDWSDYILVMDDKNMNDLNRMFDLKSNNKVFKITDYSTLDYNYVPDPWYDNNFELVYNILNDAIYNFFKLKNYL